MASTNVGDTPLQVVLEVGDHEALTELLRTIQESGVNATTQNISEAAISEKTTVTIEMSILTEKQRETLELAFAEGYYEQPREADLMTLADQLDISKSAVSQRIRNAETKLIRNALEPYR